MDKYMRKELEEYADGLSYRYDIRRWKEISEGYGRLTQTNKDG